MYCVWLQRNVNERYSMKRELLLVIFADVLISLTSTLLIFTNIGQNSQFIMPDLCNHIQFYPATEVIKVVYMILILYISLLQPLREKKIYHRLLPTGRHYGFIKTMRDFLM